MNPFPVDAYRLQPGDILSVSVWKEPDLQADVLVRSDGGISFALAGDIPAAGMSVEELRAEIAARLQKFIPDPVVTVAPKLLGGPAERGFFRTPGVPEPGLATGLELLRIERYGDDVLWLGQPRPADRGAAARRPSRTRARPRSPAGRRCAGGAGRRGPRGA